MYCPDIHVRKGNFEYIVILFIYLLYNLLTVLYQSLLYSKGTQLYIYIHILFLYSFPNYGLSQDTEYSSWCCTLAPCFSSILNVIVCIYQSSTLSPSLFIPTAPWHECIVILKLKVIILSFNGFFWWWWGEWAHFDKLEFSHGISISTNPYASKWEKASEQGVGQNFSFWIGMWFCICQWSVIRADLVMQILGRKPNHYKLIYNYPSICE